MSNDLKIDNHLNTVLKQCYYRINMLKLIHKYTDSTTRLKFANAHVLGKLNYMLSILSSLNKTQVNKVHRLIMYSARSVIGRTMENILYHRYIKLKVSVNCICLCIILCMYVCLSVHYAFFRYNFTVKNIICPSHSPSIHLSVCLSVSV